MKKKKFQFKTNLVVEELSSVPLAIGVFFAKIRLEDCNKFTEFTDRCAVINHVVYWRKSLEFICKMTGNAVTGSLNPCTCRISIRKEIKGGRSYEKLGYVDLNLAKFASQGLITRKHILQPYNDKQRQDNSTLCLSINMVLIKGDTVFKPLPMSEISDSISLPSDSRDDLTYHLATRPSSLPVHPDGISPHVVMEPNMDSITASHRPHSLNQVVHSRTASEVSRSSVSTGYGTIPKAGRNKPSSLEPGVNNLTTSRNTSLGSNGAVHSLKSTTRDTRIGSTKKLEYESQRVVDELLSEAKIERLLSSDNANNYDQIGGGNLKLCIATDGSALITGHSNNNSNCTQVIDGKG